MKKYWSYIFILLLLIILIIGVLNKKSLNQFVSGKLKEQTTVSDFATVLQLIDSKYNYVENGLKYDFTLIEFSSDNCVPCKQMKPVLEELRNSEEPKVNVIVLNTLQPENLPWMKYFGISAMPMQILLDKNGKEFFRNYGFIPARELLEKMNQQRK